MSSKISIISNKIPTLKMPKFSVDNELDSKLNDYELTSLMNKSNFTLFLGKPGSGKSSLLISFLQTPSLFKKVYHNIFLFMPSNSRNSIRNGFFDKNLPAGSLGKFFAKNDKEILKFSKNNFVINNNEDYEKVKKFLNNLKGFKIGLSWKSLNKNEQHRNISLQKLVSILPDKNCSLINLQFGDTAEEISKVENNSLVKIHSLKDIDNFNNIDELSFLINSLDLVITIQNTTAHLSLGFQKKTFVLLPTNSRWHWGVSGEQSIWYPAAQIFRQTKYNYWEDVLNNVKISLNKLLV